MRSEAAINRFLIKTNLLIAASTPIRNYTTRAFARVWRGRRAGVVGISNSSTAQRILSSNPQLISLQLSARCFQHWGRSSIRLTHEIVRGIRETFLQLRSLLIATITARSPNMKRTKASSVTGSCAIPSTADCHSCGQYTRPPKQNTPFQLLTCFFASLKDCEDGIMNSKPMH